MILMEQHSEMDGAKILTDRNPQPALEYYARPAQSGYGQIELTQIQNQTQITRSLARQPLKLLAPKTNSPAAFIYATTLGGGLVAGDQIYLDLQAHENTTTFLTTQSATKVYRSTSNQITRQSISATLHHNSLLINWPDPIICFEQANYEQHQTFNLHTTANLVVVDWQTSGRRARGERWAFSRYQSRNEIYIDNRQVLYDATRLDRSEAPLDTPFRAGRFECLATVILIGSALTQTIDHIQAQIESEPLQRRAPSLTSISRITPGAIIRILAQNPEQAGKQIRNLLSPITQQLKNDPWSRKW